MPPYNIVIPPAGVDGAVAVSDFAAEADQALATWKDAGIDGVPEEQVAQVEAAFDAAKRLVTAELVGSDGVYVVLAGHANPDHDTTRDPGRLESMLSIGIYQRPAPSVPAQKQKQPPPRKGAPTNVC